MRSHRPKASQMPDLAAPAGGPGVAGPAVTQPRGNAALAEELAAQAGEGTEVAMNRGQAAGMLAGVGVAAANAFGGGGLPALLNPSGYWDTFNEPPHPTLVQPAGGMIRKVD